MPRFIAVALMCLVARSAFAVDLTIDQNAPILMPSGKPRMECEAPTMPPETTCHLIPATVGSVIQAVLVTPLSDPSGRSSDPGNAKSGNLAIRLYGVEKPTLKLEEATLILARVDRVADPVTIARMHEALDPAAREQAK